MATASASSGVFAELSAHTLHLAVLSGREVVALRTFSTDAKTDIAAFVAEHRITGAVRASVLGSKNFLHPSSESESGAVRQPAALQAHLGKLPHGFNGSPFAVVVDAATGTTPDPTRISPWLIAAMDAADIASTKATLAELGLATAQVTLAAPIHVGAVAASLAVGETALVVLPGEDEAHLVWVTSDGVQSVATCPAGFARMFEAVQQGLGLKFKAAAGKLFYNENYDFSDAAPKVAAPLAAAIQPLLAGAPATHLHIAGLIPAQTWLVNALADTLGLAPWAPESAAFAAKLGLNAGGVTLSAASASVMQLAAAGTGQAPWVPASLDTVVATTKPVITPAPVIKPAAAVVKPAAPAAPSVIAPPKPAAPAAAKPAAKPAPNPASPIVSATPVTPPAAHPQPAPAPAAQKSKSGLLIIGATVAVVVIAVGLAAYFKKSASAARPAAVEAAIPAAAPAAPAAPVAATPPPSPAAADLSAADPRKFSNARYRFEVADKGFIQALSTPGDEVLVESAAGISLQGSYVGSDGRRKWFNVGGVDETSYQAVIKKSVQAGVTVFDVKVTHPRFELKQTFTCLKSSVKVTAIFTPINLRDPRGVIAAVHSVRLSPVALNPSQRMKAAPDSFTYAMKAGALAVSFDNTAWVRDGVDGRQTVIAGENGVAFHFTESGEAARNTLNYEIAVP